MSAAILCDQCKNAVDGLPAFVVECPGVVGLMGWQGGAVVRDGQKPFDFCSAECLRAWLQGVDASDPNTWNIHYVHGSP